MATKREADRVARLMPGGIPRWIRCYDNGGKTADRYTVVFTGRYKKDGREVPYLAMSERPFHPQGVGMHGAADYPVDTNKAGWPPAMGRSNHLGKRIPFSELPNECKRLVLSDYVAIWRLDITQWTYNANSDGYMLYDYGIPVEGAGVHHRSGPRHWKHKRADAIMYKEQAESICNRRNQKIRP